MLVIQELGEVDLCLGLVYDDLVLVGTRHHVYLLLLVLLLTHGTLPEKKYFVEFNLYYYRYLVAVTPLEASSGTCKCFS